MLVVEVKVGGQWYSTADLTGAELEAIEKVTESSWYTVNPFLSVLHYQAVVGAFLVRLGKSDAEVRQIIGSLTRAQLDASVRVADTGEGLPEEYQDGIPLAVAGPSTPTSSPAPPGGAGPRT